MGYSSSVYKAAADVLFERRLKAQRDADKRRAYVYKKLPIVKELEQQLSSTGIIAARAVVGGGNAAEQMQKLKRENLALQVRLNAVLTENGYTSDEFEPHYHCSKCNDTGYYENDGKTLVCSCLKSALIACACDELNRKAPLSLSTFESFNLGYYSKQTDMQAGISPYEQMSKILRYCKNYADSFSDKSQSILMKGATGLGKTHLSLAIANEVIKKGFGVIYVSAPALMQRLEKQYFSNKKDDDDTLDMVVDCDLLIVDDLGTEFHGQFSVSQMYNIFNSRMLLNKPIIINTNFTMRELEKVYSERFVSRISGNAQKLDFIGKDIRIMSK